MSAFPSTQDKWRRLGLLRFLASHLGVSVKQTARYWDAGWVEGRYRTPKGHRRIRYTDETVEMVKRNVCWAKETNIHIRYHRPQIVYKGTAIPVKGCCKMDDLYRRALEYGLSNEDARNVAYSPDIRPDPSVEEISWELTWAMKCTSEQEASEAAAFLKVVPLLGLIQAPTRDEFRERAKTAWNQIKASSRKKEDSCLCSAASLTSEQLALIKRLLASPSRKTFLGRYKEAAELDFRILEVKRKSFRKINESTRANPLMMRLYAAALNLKRLEKSPTAAALAKLLGISRPALYRTFGLSSIRAALQLVQSDARANRQMRGPGKGSSGSGNNAP